MRVDKEGMLFSGGGGVSPFATGKSTALFSSLVTSQIITTHNFREYILIFHERKLIDRLDSSGKKGCYYPSYKHRADMEGQLEREGSGALGGGGEAWEGGRPPWRWLWKEMGVGAQAEREACSEMQSSRHTGCSLEGPAHPPNYGSPGGLGQRH